MSDLLNKKDLTRWNRSGLSRFRYIDGNAISYLETLRLAMREIFADEQGNNLWQALDDAIRVPETETEKQKQQRWLSQYRSDRRDHAWEIMRTYARSLHVLTEHMDAYANETFLNTASQWNNVRRLVEMLDYHPAPPASAQTWLALLAKENKSGLLEAGFAVKNKPDDGSKASVFETFNELEVDAQLNALRAKDWNKSQQEFIYETGLWSLSEPVEGVSAGTLGVLIIERQDADDIGLAIEVTDIDEDVIHFIAEAKPAAYPDSVLIHQLRLLLKPDFKQSPQLTGDNIVELQEGHGITSGVVIAWQDGSTWKAASVDQVDGNRVRLSSTAPDKDMVIYLTAYSDRQTYNINGTDTDMVLVPSYHDGYRMGSAYWDEDVNKLTSINYKSDSGAHLYDYRIDLERIYYVPSVEHVAEIASTVVRSKPQGIILDGSPGDLASNNWLLLSNSTSTKSALIRTLEENENNFAIEVSATLSDIEILYANFKFDIRPQQYNVNQQPIFLTELEQRSDNHSLIPFDTDEVSELLVIGRELIIAGEDDATQVTLIDVDEINNTIKVTPALAGSKLSDDGTTEYYSRHQTTIYGNVTVSGHGESQNNKILGSGDATQINQQFYFKVEQVSFVSDKEFSSGVRAAIEIVVDDRTWKQVPSLNDSDPEAPHYMVQMNEDGTLMIRFGGDGHGRRLPTGNNNIRIYYRTGTGLSGNLEPYSLTKAVKPHYLIDSIVQPLVASGGNDLESAESLKENAPGSVLALERAVSLSDFTHLAASNSSVWQAKAFRSIPGNNRSDNIDVAVVPANGGELGSLASTLTDYLNTHTLPGVCITVLPYKSIILDLDIDITVKEDEFSLDVVAEQVRLEILKSCSLKYRKLGEALYRSQIYEIVEAVTGVANCHCTMNPYGFMDADGMTIEPPYVAYGGDGSIKRISARGDQVIYLHESLSVLKISSMAFTL